MASMEDIISLSAKVSWKLQRDYAVTSELFHQPWFAVRIHSHALHGIDASTSAFMIANEYGKPSNTLEVTR